MPFGVHDSVRAEFERRWSRARPSLLLYLHVPAGSVDVNVHPSKLEVRFSDRTQVEDCVEAAVREAGAQPVKPDSGLWGWPARLDFPRAGHPGRREA